MSARSGDEPVDVIKILQARLDTTKGVVDGLRDGSLDPIDENGKLVKEYYEALCKQWDVVHYWVYGDQVGDVK